MDIGPVSLFDCVKSNRPTDCDHLSFEEFVQIMKAYAEEPFKGKSDAPLISITEFRGNKRSKANATRSGMVVLDIDDHLTIDEVDAELKAAGISALLCSTASHRADTHKFRVFIPLETPASYDQHVLAWHVINHAIADGKADSSKIGCESMFFVPGTYPDAPSEFRVYQGISLSADGWIKLLGSKEDVQSLMGKAPSVHREKPTKSQVGRFELTDSDLDLQRTRLVSDKALDAYRSPSGAFHHARFALLMSMAGRAKMLKLNPTASDLVAIFNQIDLEDGGHYQTREYQKALLVEAQKAISLT